MLNKVKFSIKTIKYTIKQNHNKLYYQTIKIKGFKNKERVKYNTNDSRQIYQVFSYNLI